MTTSTTTPVPRPRRPKWVDVRDDVFQAYGHLPAGTPLPSEPRLCERFGVSRVTVRRAIDDLERDGVVVREQGRGTFVGEGPPSDPHPPEKLDLSGFHAQMTAQGRTVHSRVVLQGVFEASSEVAPHLNLPPSARVVRLDRLRFVDDAIDHLTRTWVEASSFPSVASTDFSEISLFGHLADVYGLALTEDQVTARLRIADGLEAQLLNLQPRTTTLATTSTAFDAEGNPRVHAHTIFASPTASLSFAVRPTSRPVSRT